MGIFFKRTNLKCPYCKKVCLLSPSKSRISETEFFEYTVPDSNFRHFICKSCRAIFKLSPILEKITFLRKVDLEFINSFDFDVIQKSIYTRKNLFGIYHTFEHLLNEYINEKTIEENEKGKYGKLKKEFEYIRSYLESLIDEEVIPRNLHEEVMKAVRKAKGRSIMNNLARWNYENRDMYCSICDSQDHYEENCPFQ